MQSNITFTIGNQTLSRSGDVSVEYLINQAKAEFGEITVTKEVEGDTLLDQVDQTDQHKAVLQTIRQNLDTVLNQVASLDDHYPIAVAKDHVLSAIDEVDTSLDELNG